MSNQKNVQKKKKGLSDGALAVIIIAAAVLVMVAFVVVVMCLPENNGPVIVDMNKVKAEINSHKVSDFEETNKVTDYVKISVKGHGDIVIRLRPDVAPETVKNFKDLVSKGFYNGLTFHRVYPNFMIQGGDPKGDGTGNSDKTITGEFSANGFSNTLSHVRGVISMARGGRDMNSASCQFFICHADSQSSLDGQYASFGYVMAGLEVVDSITKVELTSKAGSVDSVPTSPVEKVIIEKIVFVKDTHNH